MVATRVLVVNDGEVMRRALEVVRNRVIDLILSDNHFPDGQGTRLVLEIGRLSPHTACLFITGGVINPADALDDFTVLKQPFKTGDLIDAVQATVVRSRIGRS